MRELIASWALPFLVMAVVLLMVALKEESHSGTGDEHPDCTRATEE